jgi:hypothetical protein
MTHEGAPAGFIHEVTAVRVVIPGAREARRTRLSERFCNRLLIKRVRVRNDHDKGIADQALNQISPE